MSASKNIKKIIRNMSAGVIQIGSQEKEEPVHSFSGGEITPLSPSSKFTESSIDIPGQNLIKYMMLSHWDNILGPRVVHVWNMGTSSLDSGFLSRISSQSLSGEICREVTSFIDHKLYEIPDADVFVTAFIFTAMGISGPCVHALSIVIQKSDMTFFLNIQQLFLKCFERIIRKFKVNLDQVIYLIYYFMHMISVVFHLKSIFTFISVYMQSKCMLYHMYFGICENAELLKNEFNLF